MYLKVPKVIMSNCPFQNDIYISLDNIKACTDVANVELSSVLRLRVF